MPSLKDSLVDASGYVLLPAKPPIMAIVPANSSPSTNLRCPLPPFNSDPDTLRQFEDQSAGPKNRVWPIPQQSGGVTNTTITKTVISGSSSSGSSSTVTPSPTLSATFATLTTGLLVSAFQGSVAMAKSFQLLSMGVSNPCEVRIYGSASAQAADIYRLTGAPVPPEITANLITCVTFDTVPYTWTFQSVSGVNGSSPQTSMIYVSVFNTIPSSQTPVTVTIQFLPLES